MGFLKSCGNSDETPPLPSFQAFCPVLRTYPPSLLELAQQVGMCDYNLRRGFKEIFNTTVFGYLRDRRMEKAQQLLLDGQLKVATVARTVGYDSPTSFNAAFKHKFGASPKAYQMSIRK
ncbi:AraC family transcriptional regulator [Oscillatoria sp. CS-180]|uniref:helix-turn-helix transcriptional regulator n=1 Tax=Oscillatoria sp. CS-180 TaxID=3021720 RepID=UPI00232F68C1|nr:AraC family transcriptional regulator [Oscillatoria sp. CS-180]MDB9527192.1 AraC family transcriptional regulator [Oscillatoria sp. CS-180]